MRVERGSFDYCKICDIPEVKLRVELLQERLQYLSRGKSPRILEVGLGSGDVTLMLAENFDRVFCLDSDKDKCSIISKRINDGHQPEFICSTIEDAHLPRLSYDHILLQNMLEHFKDPVDVLSRLKGLFSPDGHIHISVPLANSLHRWLGIEMELIKDIDELTDSDKEFGHYRVYNLSLLRQHISLVGLKISYELPFYLKPLTTDMLKALPMEIHRALYRLGQRFPEFASYIYGG